MRSRAGAKAGLLAGVPAGLANRPLFAMLLAALSALFPVTAVAASPIGGLALGGFAGGGVAFAESPYFPMKVQPWWTGGLALEFPLGSQFGLGLSLGFHQAGASGMGAGFLYRGYYGLEAGAYLQVRGLHMGAVGGTELLGGMAVGATASFDVYSRTELLFYYPSFLMEPYLEVHFPRLGRHTFSLGLPNRVQFRKDLDMSASLGLNLRWRWYPKWKREGA